MRDGEQKPYGIVRRNKEQGGRGAGRKGGQKSANHEQDPAGEEINESSALSGSRNSGFLHKVLGV